jgi:hypothetical protein
LQLLGDSYVEAFQVELSETFLKIAEKHLSDRGHKGELMNFGRSGFTTTEELLLVREDVAKFAPNLIALFFYPPNDIADVSKDLASDKIRPFFFYEKDATTLQLDSSFTDEAAFKLKKLVNPLKRNSALVSLATERYQLLGKDREISPESDCRIRDYLSLATSKPDSHYSKAFELNKRLLREIAGMIRNRAEMLLVTMDTPGWKTTEERCFQSNDPSFNPFFYEDELRNLALEENIHYLGLQQKFRRDWEKNRRELHWGHWNYEGHKFVAGLLADEIEMILGSLGSRIRSIKNGRAWREKERASLAP